jgi:hypothetical protein
MVFRMMRAGLATGQVSAFFGFSEFGMHRGRFVKGAWLILQFPHEVPHYGFFLDSFSVMYSS